MDSIKIIQFNRLGANPNMKNSKNETVNENRINNLVFIKIC